jgi:hypothetical protein
VYVASRRGEGLQYGAREREESARVPACGRTRRSYGCPALRAFDAGRTSKARPARFEAQTPGGVLFSPVQLVQRPIEGASWRLLAHEIVYYLAMQTRVVLPVRLISGGSFERLPQRIFIDSCTVQTLQRYGEFVYDGGSIRPSDVIHRIPDGLDNIDALRAICQVTSCALFQWIVSDASRQEAAAKGDAGHLQWLFEIDNYARVFLDEMGPSPESRVLAARLDEPKFGYLGVGDRILLRDAIFFQCDAFLTMERKLPRNAAHIERELGIRVLTPIGYWEMLRPWAALWC